jgi:TrmH family RNA methyltransferase
VWQIDSLQVLSDAGVRLIGTTSHDSLGVSHIESVYESDLDGLLGIVLGNEAHGLPADAEVDSWVTVEHVGRSESLNVAMAGTVIAMQVARHRARSGQ